jgi:calcyphosin
VPKFQSILIERFRAALRARGARGIMGLQRQFKIADNSGNGMLEFEEFNNAVYDFGVDIDPQDVKGLFKSIDVDGSGEISFD